jgi:hypothetical protein
MSVYKKLMQARIALQSREIKKSGFNSFAKYSYMELADFLIPTQQIFADLGLCGVVSFGADLATLKIVDTETGETLFITSPMSTAALKGCHEVQNLGAVQTYLRRYLWVAAMEITEHDALDSSPPVVKKTPSKDGIDSFQDTPKADAFRDLQPEIQAFMRNVAGQVTSSMPHATRAIDIIELALEQWPNEDPNQLKIALWHLLDSKTRAAIKLAQREKETA